MSQMETIQTPQDYVNYTFNIEARGVAEVSSELMGLSNTVSNILGQLAFKTSEFLTHTESMAMGAGLAISGMFASATKDAINFQQQIANVQAIGGETIDAQAIGNAAMEYSNKFGMATASMTEGLEALARAGITSTSVMKEVLAEGVKLSKLEGIDLEDSINDLISTTNLLSEAGVDMNDANYGQLVQEMNQHIVSTSESAPINAQNIIQSLQHVGGYASASGMDQDDLFAVIAQLGARGTKGEMAGTALRAFIAAGQKDTAQRALARVGLNVSDLWNDNGETMLSISEMKNVLDEALEARGYSKQEKLEFYSDFVGYKQANQIMKIDTAEVEKYKESIATAWDLGKKLDTILGTVRGNLDRIWQITQNFMTRVGSQLLTIAGVILEPVRALLEFVTALPGADTAVAVGMIFVAFRTGLMIFNKLVPAVSGFMSGITDAKSQTRGFRGEWQKTRDEVQKTKEIIDLIRHGDQEGLAERHYREHGLSAKNKMGAEYNIAGQMYMASDWYKENGRIKWDDLEEAAKDMIVERFKPTQAFKDNYEYYVESIRQATNQIVMNPVDLAKVNIEEEPIEAINVHVAQIFELLKSDRTTGTSDAPESNLERNAQANVISQIMKNANIRPEKYGNYEFDFRDSEKGFEELKKATEKAYSDLERKVEKFSNTAFANISEEQKNTYRKVLYREAMTPEGKKYSARANESEVRFALDRGRFEKEDIEWYQGIKDSQIREMGRLAGVDMSDFNKTTASNDQRQEYISQIHDALNQKSADERKRITEQIVQETNKKWKEEVIDKDTLTIDPANILRNNANIAKEITQALNINVQGGDYAKAVHSFFEKEENRNDTKMVDTATQIIFENLKQNEKFTLPEQRELRYTIENLQRLRNTFQYFSDNNMHEDFRDEMGQIIEGMTVYNALFRKGGAELGEALVKGFVVEGLGIHSPGYMFWALVDEQTNINKAILQSKGIFNKNASLLGLEMTNAFDSSLGLNRVFDSGIEYLRRDTDVIKDIIGDFNREDFRTDDETDLPYDLLPSQQDVQDDTLNLSQKKALEHFVRPYGFDMSNYERFGTKFGTDWTYDTRFQSMMWFMQHDFDYEKMFESGQFDEDDIYDHMDLFNKFFAVENTWLQSKTFPGDMKEETFNEMNKFLEDYYFGFLATLSQNMHDIITQSNGLVDNVKLYRGGRLPLTGENLGEYLGTTSTSYAARIGDYYAWGNGAVNYKTNVFAPEGTLGIYPNEQLLRQRQFPDGILSHDVYKNQLEYTLGNGQPYINLPNEKGNYSTALSDEPDILLLTPDQIEEVQGVVIDEIASMINSGRADSNILNLSGIQVANSLQKEKFKVLDEDKRIDNNNIDVSPMTSDNYWGHGFHDSNTGMLFDAAYYIKKTQNKNVAKPEDFFKLIESVHGKQAAKEAEKLLNSQYSDAIKDNNNIKLPGLMNLISNKNKPFKDSYRYLKDFSPVNDINVAQAFDLIDAHPEIKDEITDILMDFIPSRRGAKFSRKFFEDNNLMNEELSIPSEYVWLLGSDVANNSKDHLLTPNNSFIYNSGGKPTASLNEAIELWEKLGPEAMLNSDFRYHYDDNLRPTVDNSFERMMTGLVFGTLGDKSAAYGSRYRRGGIDLYPNNTESDGALQTLSTFIHEFTHMAMQQDYRRSLDANDEMFLPDITSAKDILGYDRSFFEEFEANFVANEVFGKIGLEKMDIPEERQKAFYDVIAQAGYTNNLQWELYDEWIKTISENIDKFIDIGEAFDKKYSDLSAAEISQKWDDIRKLVNVNNTSPTSMPGFGLNGYIDYINQQQKEEEERRKNFGMPGLVENPPANYQAINKRQEEIAALRKQMAEDEARWTEEGIQYAVEKRKQLEELRKKQKVPYQLAREIQEKMLTGQLEYLTHYQNRGGVLNASKNTSKSTEDSSEDEEYKDRINKEMATKYAGLFPDMDNKFNQARYNVNKDGQGNQRVMSAIDWGEKVHNKVHDKAFSVVSGIADRYDEKATQEHLARISSAKDKINGIIEPLNSLNEGLGRAAEIFPILSPLVWGLDTALWALNTVSTILEFTETLLSISKIQDILVSWGLFTAEEAETAAKGTTTITTLALTGALGGLEAAIAGPILIALAAVIAILAILYLAEKNHADSLKESKKAIEDSNKELKASKAIYESAHKARLSEHDITRKQNAALKESIALKKYELSRSKQLKEIDKKSRLENDRIWGETNSLRTTLQTDDRLVLGASLIPFIGTMLGPVLGMGKMAAGPYEPSADKHSDNIYQMRTILDNAALSNQLTVDNIKDWLVDNNKVHDNYQDINKYYMAHTRDFAYMEAFAPSLEKLYEVETQAQRIYGKENARDSEMFKQALGEVANETGLDGETLGQYLDYMQTEANVEYGRQYAESGFGEIVAEAHRQAYEYLNPEGGMGDLDTLQEKMVLAAVEEEARKAKEELFQNAVLEYMNAIMSVLTLDTENARAHWNAGNTYLDSIKTIDENKERIAQDSLKVAEQGLRKDYGTKMYSYYGDTPFGGAIESARAAGLSIPNYEGSSIGNQSVMTNTSNNQKQISTTENNKNNALSQQINTVNDSVSKSEQKNKNTRNTLSDFLDKPISSIKSLFTKEDNQTIQEENEQPQTIINIETININTEDDPEKIKSAFMNLIIEMQEQIMPRQVSRTVGQSKNSTKNTTEGVDDKTQESQNNTDTRGI